MTKSGPGKQPAEGAIKDIRRATRRHFSAEEKFTSCWKGSEARRALPNSVAATASPPAVRSASTPSFWSPATNDRRGSESSHTPTRPR